MCWSVYKSWSSTRERCRALVACRQPSSRSRSRFGRALSAVLLIVGFRGPQGNATAITIVQLWELIEATSGLILVPTLVWHTTLLAYIVSGVFYYYYLSWFFFLRLFLDNKILFFIFILFSNALKKKSGICIEYIKIYIL